MNVAFIPVRGGSKSIPLKNIKEINGKPLVYWTVAAACKCERIDKVYIATDSEAIKSTVEGFCQKEQGSFEKAEVIGRSAESACDTASTESAMLEFAGKYDFDNIVLIQATSPMLTGEDLNKGFEIYDSEGTDSVLSVVPQKRFIWNVDDKNIASPVNYDVYNRPRRQDFDEYYVENGAFYICSRKDLLSTKNRVSGNIRIVPMNEDTFYEIDEPSDWNVIESLMKKRGTNSTLNIIDMGTDYSKRIDMTGAKDIPYKMFLTDCDGCLTDGGMYYSEKGDELKKFNTKDGMGFGMLRSKGIFTGVITGERVDLNRRRFEKLRLDILVPGCLDKVEAIKKICSEYNITPADIVYVGDDINDVDVIKMAGFGCCPADANIKARQAAKYVTKAKGGEGVIREVVEHLLYD